MELSEITGDVNLDDLDSEVLPWLVIDLFLKDRDFWCGRSKSISAHTQYAEYVNQIFFFYRTRVKKNLVANHRKLYCVRGTSSFSVAETYLGKNNALVQMDLFNFVPSIKPPKYGH